MHSTPPLPKWTHGRPDHGPIQLPKLSHFWLVFDAPKSPKSGAKKPVPLPRPAGGVVIFGTLQGAISGTQTHSRRTGRKLGRLHRARQGLVRVPESNTKCGGKRGKTGGVRASDLAQVSVSPEGFPSEKNLFHSPVRGFVPLFTGQLFIVAEGLPREDSREATGTDGLCPVRHAV